MSRLALALLGPPQIQYEGSQAAFPYEKVRALLIYLAVEAGRAHARDALAELLWPGRPARVARHNLSQALTALRGVIDGDAYLSLARDAVQFRPDSGCWLDLADFNTHLDACARHAHPDAQACADCARERDAAVRLYRGDFLDQYQLPDSAGFEQWALVQREAVRQRAWDALAHLSRRYQAQGNLDQAIASARRQLDLDPLNEISQRQLMRLLADGGQRSAALAQYEQSRALLQADLGVDPEPETRELYERLKAGRAYPAAVAPAAGPPPAHNLPAQATPFIGRRAELAHLADQLTDPACRLLAIVGPGGVGKTRLALQAAADRLAAFPDGVWFVSLAPVRSPDLLAAAIVDALPHLSFSQDDPKTLLLNYLSRRQALLVLDNFEHLLDGATLLAELMERAPGVKLVATSRERLDLRGEWVVELGGLEVPPLAIINVGVLTWERDYSAVRLFAESARRVRASFVLDERSLPQVARLCRLMEGLPLGIELAAAWIPALPVEAIADEIERSLDFLATSLRDVPPRHRSLRAVFDQSWNLLTPQEQSVFSRLSVFRAGFTRTAAAAVAGAVLPDLSALVRKSLLHPPSGGRYDIHELLRQYGQGKLTADPAEAQQTRERHSAYFLGLLAQREADMKGRDQDRALAEIAADLENIRTAWDWATEQPRPDLIAPALTAFWLFYEERGRYSEAEAHLRHAVEALQSGPAGPTDRELALGQALARWGSYHMRLGHLGQAVSSLTEAIDRLRPLDAPREVAFALNILAAVRHLQGSHLEERGLLQESVALGQAAGDQWITGYSLNDLGLVTLLLGDTAEAERLCQQSQAVFAQIGDRRGMAFVLRSLGRIAQQRADYAEAERLFRESLALWRANGHRWGAAATLIHLGAVARATGDLPAARALWLEAIQVAIEVRTMPPVLEALVELAALGFKQSQPAPAAEILRAVLDHPSLTAAIQARAAHLLASLPPGPAFGGPPPQVDTLVAALLSDGPRPL